MVAFPPDYWVPGDTRAGKEAREVNQFIAQIDKVNATHPQFGLDPGNTGAANTAALQGAINFAWLHGIPMVYIPAGLYLFAMITHPNSNATWTKTVLAHRGGVKLRGAGSALTTLFLINNAGLQAGSQNRFVTNWDPDADVAVDVGLEIESLTLDGNALHQTTVGSVMHGVQYWNAERIRVNHDVIIKNMRGDDTGTLETFHLDAVLCQDVEFEDFVILGDDGGDTASGASVNFCDRYRMTRFTVLGMKNGQGCTRFKSSNGHVGDAYAGDCGASGFNSEQCENETEGMLISGSASNPLDPSHSSHAYTKGQAHPNAVGFTYLFSQGGGNVRSKGCIADGNTVRGVGVSGSLTATAATGTAGTTLPVTATKFSPGHVDNYVSVGGHPFVQIQTYVSPTQVTTDSPHGGAPGDGVEILCGTLDWEGSISGSPNGFQPLDATTQLKDLTRRRCNLNGTRFDNNGNDLVDAARGSQTTVPRASGLAPANTISDYVAGTEFYNPFPRDMWAIVAGSSGNTSTRSRHPKDAAQSWGIGDGIFPLEAGGAITCTGTLKLRFQ